MSFPCPAQLGLPMLDQETALQVTLVDPIGNVEGLVGLQVIATGAAPPITAGAGYVTLTACPSRDGCVWDAGQVIFGASGVGVGFVVDRSHAAAHSAAINAPVRNRIIATLKPILEASVDRMPDQTASMSTGR